MANNDLQVALNMLEHDKGISRQYVLDALKTALTHAYKKNYKDDGENVEILVNYTTGEFKVIAKKLVVPEEDYLEEESSVKIPLKEAKKIKRSAKVGEEIEVEIIPKNFGRIAAQTGKQIILQKLREAEREQILAEFQIKSNDIISAVVERSEKVEYRNPDAAKAHENEKPRYNIIFDIGRAEAVMPPKEQVRADHYRIHEKYRVYVVDVKSTPKGPHIVVSRSQPDLVKRLFEREVPEIKDGIVEIKSIAREAGVRSKIAVWSNDEEVDPVGACVGNRGSRVGAVVEELRGEKVDIVKYSAEPEELITAALSPAKVLKVMVDEFALLDKKKEALVVVEESQLSLAIGKEGLNARLAAKLTGWKIDIKSDVQYAKEMEELGVEKEEYMEYLKPEEEKEPETQEPQEIQAQPIPEGILEEIGALPQQIEESPEDTEPKEDEPIIRDEQSLDELIALYNPEEND